MSVRGRNRLLNKNNKEGSSRTASNHLYVFQIFSISRISDSVTIVTSFHSFDWVSTLTMFLPQCLRLNVLQILHLLFILLLKSSFTCFSTLMFDFIFVQLVLIIFCYIFAVTGRQNHLFSQTFNDDSIKQVILNEIFNT